MMFFSLESSPNFKKSSTSPVFISNLKININILLTKMNNFYPGMASSYFCVQTPLYGGKIQKCECGIHGCEQRICELNLLITDLELRVMKLRQQNSVLKQMARGKQELEGKYEIKLIEEKQFLKRLNDIEKEKKIATINQKKIQTKNPQDKLIDENRFFTQINQFKFNLSKVFDKQSQTLMQWKSIEKFITTNFKLHFQTKQHPNEAPLLNDSKRTIVDDLKSENSHGQSRTKKKVKNLNIMDKLLIKQL